MPNNREPGSGVPIILHLFNRFASLVGLTHFLRRRILKSFAKQNANLVDSNIASIANVLIGSLDLRYSSFTGLLALREICKAAFSNSNLLAEQRIKLDGASDIPVECPIFIVGFPRTGTTLLHNLLAEEPGYQAPLMWELHEPAISNSDSAKQAMREKVQKFIDANNLLAPNLQNVHPMFVNGNEECLKLLENSFFSPTFLLYNQAPAYEKWLLEQIGGKVGDSAYEMHKLQLQLLNIHHSRRGTWVLKSPAHALLVNNIRRVYPDSLLINTVRDPLISIASFCSLAETIRSIFDERVDRHQIGQLALRFYQHSCDEYLNLIRKPHKGIVEISFKALCQSPGDILQKTYELLGLPFDKHGLQRRVDGWMRAESKKLKSKHSYELRNYGLDPSVLNNRFEGQIERLRRLDSMGGIARACDLQETDIEKRGTCGK